MLKVTEISSLITRQVNMLRSETLSVKPCMKFPPIRMKNAKPEILPNGLKKHRHKYSKSSATDAHLIPMAFSGLLPFLFFPLEQI